MESNEVMGQKMATVIRNILDDLELTPEQEARVPKVCRRHLEAMAEEGRGAE
jgi:hypothetical protein